MSHTKIKSFEDACKILNLDSSLLPDVSMISETLRKFIVATYKLTIIAQALNSGWEPDWDNSSEWKYAPYFRMSGSGFSCLDCVNGDSNSDLGSRLCFKSREIAKYAGEQFTDLYKEQMLIQK